MYERSYGYRYDEQKDLSTTAIAKRVRQDIKQAVSEGLLPSAWSYSVTSRYFSGGSSIDVEVRDCADAWQECDGSVPGSPSHVCPNVWCAARKDPQYAHAATAHQVLTLDAMSAKLTLERIHGAYNHDGSDSMTDYYDVNYYGHVQFESPSGVQFRAKEKARLAARKDAREAGEVVGKIVNYGRDRSSVVHIMVRTPDGKAVLACGARARNSMYKAADDAAVTCSRCAKRGA